DPSLTPILVLCPMSSRLSPLSSCPILPFLLRCWSLAVSVRALVSRPCLPRADNGLQSDRRCSSPSSKACPRIHLRSSAACAPNLGYAGDNRYRTNRDELVRRPRSIRRGPCKARRLVSELPCRESPCRRRVGRKSNKSRGTVSIPAWPGRRQTAQHVLPRCRHRNSGRDAPLEKIRAPCRSASPR